MICANLILIQICPDGALMQASKKGNLLTHMKPSVNPPKEIDDPEDLKPEDWVDEPKMDDPNASKPGAFRQIHHQHSQTFEFTNSRPCDS